MTTGRRESERMMRSAVPFVAAASLIALVACSAAEPPPAPARYSLGCSSATAKVEWTLPVPSARTMTRVYVQSRDSAGAVRTSTHDLGPAITPSVLPAAVNDRLDWLVEQLNEAGEPAELEPGPAMPASEEMFADFVKPGRFVAYSGADQIDVAFTLTCPDSTGGVDGVLHTWMKPVLGVLDCTVTPPSQSYGAMVLSYCSGTQG
jgi:hypothetical protein